MKLDSDFKHGFSLVEYLVALTLVMLAFVTWLRLSATAVQSGKFVSRLAGIGTLSQSKASEVIRGAGEAFSRFPTQVNKLGSIAPAPVLDGYYDLLDDRGQPVSGIQAKSEAKFLRQWMLVRDTSAGEIKAFVSVVCLERRGIMRLARASKIEGVKR
ncbi:MAG: hypothetical protein RMM17_03245 [Acidobacteriota bacterium]|nr:hypothetical protein [Blastocatellia bacterium]MDW8411685.1 hypothetical protein [Acidobacteriota bacterium]